MAKPLVSVIIPVYNEEKYIDRCVESILKQTYESLEIILVNGGSNDGSKVCCDAWKENWSKKRTDYLMERGLSALNPIQVLHIENEGVSVSRNKGIEAASGELITFVDADDWLKEDAIEKMYQAMISSDTDMAGLSFEVMTDDGNYAKEIKTGINNPMAVHFLQNNALSGDVHVWGRLYKREIIGDLRFRKGLTIGEDMLFLIEYVKKCRAVSCLEYKGYNYFKNSFGTMSKPFTNSAMDQIRCWREARAIIGDSDKLKANMLISIMLTAGRIALLPKAEWKTYSENISELADELKYNKTRGAMKLLDKGYKIKVTLFSINPGLYLKLYSRHKGA